MDILVATCKSRKFSRGHTCAQVFVTDNFFVYVVPVKNENEILWALKQFAKVTGSPGAIICDAARAQKFVAFRRLYNEVGTTLRVLEEDISWPNRAGIHIGIIKKATRKYTEALDYPLAFWN